MDIHITFGDDMVVNNTTYPNCSRILIPDMVFSGRMDPGVTMALSGIRALSHQPGSHCYLKVSGSASLHSAHHSAFSCLTHFFITYLFILTVSLLPHRGFQDRKTTQACIGMSKAIIHIQK